MTTPPTDDLRARHIEALRELRDSGDVSDWRAMESAIDYAIAALSALPAGGGKVVARVQRGPAPHDPLYAMLLPGVTDIPEGTPLCVYTPPPDAAVGAQGEAVAWGVRGGSGELWMCDFGLATIDKKNADGFAEWAAEHRSADGPFTVVPFHAPAAGKGDPINPAFWIQAIRTACYTTDCSPKQQTLLNAADNLERYIALTRQPVAGDGPEQLTLRELLQALSQHHKHISGDTRAFPAALMAAETAGALWRIIRENRRAAPADTPADGGEGK